MFKTIGILAHVDAGKTTLSEQILFRSGAIRAVGRVDNGDTIMDHDATERRRGITIYSDVAQCVRGDTVLYLLDTPGHVDFSAEMERTLKALDFAVLVVSCVEGVQAHTEMIWKLLRLYGVPALFFLNKTDRTGADVQRTLAQIHTILTPDALLLDDGLESAAEALAERDETLLDRYLESGYTESVWLSRAQDLLSDRVIFPCFSGSALSGSGMDRFLSGMDRLTRTCYDPAAPFSALVYKVRHDESGNRVSFLKILSGVLHAKDMIASEKVHEIRAYIGEKYTSLPQAEAGQICAVTGLSLPVGTQIGTDALQIPPQMIPLLSAGVAFDPAVPVTKVLEMFRLLEAEDPMLSVQWQPDAQQIQVSVMGPIQLEVLSETCGSRFGISVSFGKSEILYRETITKPVYGCGHFEPLRHYAEVHLVLRPLPRGSGIRFRSVCPTDVLRTNWQRLIETHVFEKTHRGALCGFPVTDVEVVLVMGRAHEKHTEGGDFRQSLYRAVRHALFSAESILLEPFYRFTIRVPADSVGRVLSDLERMSAAYDAPETEYDDAVIRGRCPASEMMAYHTGLSAFTKGRGSLQVQFDGYDVCHDPQEVISAHPYDRRADVENTADSVFCAHGAGYTVAWDEAAEKMHCEIDKKLLEALLSGDAKGEK